MCIYYLFINVKHLIKVNCQNQAFCNFVYKIGEQSWSTLELETTRMFLYIKMLIIILQYPIPQSALCMLLMYIGVLLVFVRPIPDICDLVSQ